MWTVLTSSMAPKLASAFTSLGKSLTGLIFRVAEGPKEKREILGSAASLPV